VGIKNYLAQYLELEKMKKLIGLLLFVLGFTLSGWSQPDKASVETINDKKYYVHIVQQGNTLYGIHQLYNTSIETLMAANDGLSNELTVGQRILIPIEMGDPKFYQKHTVLQGETLYGISKKYNCSVEDLMKMNLDLSDGISPGQVITVPRENEGQADHSEVIHTDPVQRVENNDQPNVKVSLEDSIVIHTVLEHETLYSIAKRFMVTEDTIMVLNNLNGTRLKKGEQIKIPVKNVNYEVIEKDLTNLAVKDPVVLVDKLERFKEVYKVALLLPLMLDKNDAEMSKPISADEVREMYATTKISFDFYQGFLLAADSLSNAGLNIEIFVYDTRKDTAVIGKIFEQPEFNDMDLVVGPISRNTIDYTAKLCGQRQIRIVLPFNSDSDVLHQNPYVYKGVASNMSLLDGTVDYILEHHKQHNIILIKPTSPADVALFERVLDRFNTKMAGMSGTYNVKVIESGLGSSSGKELSALMRKDTANIVLIPSTNLTFVSGAMSRLNKVINMNPYSKNFKIIAFGLEEWNKFEDLDLKYRIKTYQHYASYRYMDYNTPASIDFIRTYRSTYGTDPNVFSCQGFDYGMYFLSALHLYGTNFDLAIADHRMKLTQNDFEFRLVQAGSGRENQHVYIVKYDNYTLIQMK